MARKSNKPVEVSKLAVSAENGLQAGGSGNAPANVAPFAMPTSGAVHLTDGLVIVYDDGTPRSVLASYHGSEAQTAFAAAVAKTGVLDATIISVDFEIGEVRVKAASMPIDYRMTPLSAEIYAKFAA